MKLDNYINKYIDEEGYDASNEYLYNNNRNKEIKLYVDIVSDICSYTNIYKPIPYLNKLIIPLIRLNVYYNLNR